MSSIISYLKNRVKSHEKQLSYMTTTKREMYIRKGAIKDLMELIEYFEENYDSIP